MENQFLNQVTSHTAFTENGAVSHSTSGLYSVDYFAKAGTYRNRTEEDVSASISAVWAESPILALKTIFYLRNITRKSKGFFISESVQKGQGVKDEFIKLLKWLENSHPDTLYENLWLVPVVGCWKDLWYDSANSGYFHYINPIEVYKLVEKGIKDKYNRALIAKYLPQIRSKSNIKNERQQRLNSWANGLCKYLKWDKKEYRKFKSNPENTAHLWQRNMCSGYWDKIDFSKISGKALFNLVALSGHDKMNPLKRHGIEEKYINWLETQPVAKFTGYVHELYKAVPKSGIVPLVKKITLDKQFDGLIKLAKQDEGGIKDNVWVCVDTSDSMCNTQNYNSNWQPIVGGYMPIDICLGMGVYFSEMNTGAFKDYVVAFDSHSQIIKISGTFCEKVQQIRQVRSGGSTNFQSIIDEIIRVRTNNPEIPLSDFPSTVLVISDMQFNPSGCYHNLYDSFDSDTKTNYEQAIAKLKTVGIDKMKFIWWYVDGRSTEVPNKFDDAGITIISGFDPAIITNICGGVTEVIDEKTGEKRALTPYENMLKALDQDVLKQLSVN